MKGGSIADALRSIRGAELEKGLSEGEIGRVAARLPGPLPAEVAEALRLSTGFKSREIDLVDLSGEALRFEFREILPHGFPIAKSAYGNFWVVDVGADGKWREIFYFCHDPPVCAIQFNSLRDFLEACAAGLASVVEDADKSADAAAGNPGVDPAQALASSDARLARFAATVPPGFHIHDLRPSVVGVRGFAWGYHEPVRCMRLDDELVFAVEDAPPARKGILSRLFGGGR